MRLYKPTFMDRATVDKGVRCVVPADLDAPEDSYRDVQIVIPDSPTVYAGLFDDDIDVESEIGADRSYNLPSMTSGARIQFKIQSHQTLWIMAEDSLAFCSVIIEYVQE